MDFDKHVDRTDTYSFKWEKYKGTDILPMWVADSEFECAAAIKQALMQRVEHGVYGYHLPAQHTTANDAVIRWLALRHNWQVESDWIVWMPGVVPGFNVACKAYSKPGQKVLIQTPNYPPLLAAPALNNLQRVLIDTVREGERWTLDFEQLEQEASDPDCTLMILCNPMNPVGSVLTEHEMMRVREICLRHDVMLCSDEIHCDLILEQGVEHLPAGSFSGLEDRSVTLMAASKTFNIAGLGAAFAIIPDKTLRRKFSQAAMGIVPWVNFMGLVATEAAFTECDAWYEGQIDYLRANRDYLFEHINGINGLSMLKPEATFLAWIDASGLNVPNPQIYFENQGVGPSPGADFGNKQFVRINYGCPRSHLELAMSRLAKGM